MLKKKILLFAVCLLSISVSFAQERLIYHTIKTDAAKNILPWYNPDPGISYDHVLHLVWNFWDTMRTDINGIPYYMNHQIWQPEVNESKGIGGDQLAMALSSWRLYYQYTGNEQVKENMKFIADYYLNHSLSPANANWPDIPFPYNTFIYSGIYDGDMVIGKDYTQPDKAGSFGIELVRLYKLMAGEDYPNTVHKRYLEAAIKIANTLARHVKDGSENNSPMPFKVNAYNDSIGILKNNDRSGEQTGLSNYTTNWSATLELFLELQKLEQGETKLYQEAFDKIMQWMKKFPMQNNKWGPFFEDVPGWSDTQINAVTWAQFIMNHREYFPAWQQDVKKIFDWVYEKLKNEKWKKYGVTVIDEQTAYRQPGNSHTARQASAELQYMSLTDDRVQYSHAIRQLNWGTYMVDKDGKNFYPTNAVWMTDGYGDYVRHYLRAMAAAPELAPPDDHLLSTTSVVQHVFYRNQLGKYYYPSLKNPDVTEMHYATYDTAGAEVIRLAKKPAGVLFNNITAKENDKTNGYEWKPLNKGGVLTIRRTNSSQITILR
jgi:hypothetical protein